MKKATHPFVQLMVLLLLAVGMLTVVSIPTVVMTLLGVDIISRPMMLLEQSVTQLLSFAVPVWLMLLIYYRGQQRDYCRFDFGGRQWLNALAAAVIMVLLVPVIDWITVWNDGWNLGRVGEMFRHLQEQTEGILEQMVGTDTIMGLIGNLVVIALIPAVCEEIFFRAGIQNLLQRWWSHGVGPHVAIWVTALIFSLAHGELFAFMPRFVMGLVLGYLYVGSGSILPNMMAHFVNNAMVVVIYWLTARGVLDIDPEEPLRLDFILTACCSLAAVMAFVTTFGKKLKISC